MNKKPTENNTIKTFLRELCEDELKFRKYRFLFIF